MMCFIDDGWDGSRRGDGVCLKGGSPFLQKLEGC